MEKIKSFTINHDTLERGLYVSRIDENIITYDMRFIKPNNPPYLDNDGLHTLEHLFATFVRNSKHTKDIVYFGPMGCRTGFYFIVKDSMKHDEVIKLIQETCVFVYNYTGIIPGSKKEECGNYLDHNLEKAKQYAYDYYQIIKEYKVEELDYDYKQR